MKSDFSSTSLNNSYNLGITFNSALNMYFISISSHPSLHPMDDGVSTIVSAAWSQSPFPLWPTMTTGEWSALPPPEQRTALPISSLKTDQTPLPGRCRAVWVT